LICKSGVDLSLIFILFYFYNKSSSNTVNLVCSSSEIFMCISTPIFLCIYVHLYEPDIAIATELERAKTRGESVQLDPEISDYVSDRPKGLFREFLYDVNPISEEDWKKSSIFFKIILIVRAPAMLLLQLFIPVVNPTVEKRGWSKLLNCFQLCVTPTAALFLLNG
jgi:hypothetical protein